jgi:hypothetical protein
MNGAWLVARRGITTPLVLSSDLSTGETAARSPASRCPWCSTADRGNENRHRERGDEHCHPYVADKHPFPVVAVVEVAPPAFFGESSYVRVERIP